MRNRLSDSAAAASIAPNTTFSQPDLLCFSHLRWHFVTQRPQHLLTRAARDRRVFFWEEPLFTNPSESPESVQPRLEISQEGPSLWVIQPHLPKGMDAENAQRDLLNGFITRNGIADFIAWYYTPMALGFTSNLKPAVTVYDCMDELKNFLNPPPQLAEREQQLFTAADVVFTGGISLYEAKQRQHVNVHAFPSSIEVPHFAQARNGYSASLSEPADQVAIPHPRAGFYGVVDERFDIALLGEVARLRPHVHFVILGPVVKIDPATLPQASNIHYLGGKKYEQLPAYLAGWDIALLPFALNDATRFISPTKTPEYLAAGKRVVSTPIRDVVRGYGDANLVAIADTPDAFAAALDQALQPAPAGWNDAVEKKLAESSWDSTWASMQHEIDRIRHARRPVASGAASSTANVSGYNLSATHSASSPLASLRVEKGPSLMSVKTPLHPEQVDYLVVGAGFAGSVIAERLASQLGKRVLVIDKRNHIAGNAYDFYNEHGILIHQYGPHIFHTNSEKVLNYLSRFTQWRPYEHRVLTSVDGKLLPMPINLDTVNQLYGLDLDSAGLEKFLAARVETPEVIRTSEDICISRVGRELYEKFFRNYTRKQWGLDPSELDAAVAGRIPVRFDHDDRYFTDTYQVMPLHGYTRMFERMLDQPRLTVRTGVDYADIAKTYKNAKIVFTGPIDEYYGFRFGALPYRSLEFKHETHDVEFFQKAPVVNFPNDNDYTRITEFKYLTGQKHAKTSIVYEYPRAEGDPYYPIPRPENAARYQKYCELAERDTRVHFCGRLANYKYFNMDQVVAQALTTFRSIADAEPVTLPITPQSTAASSRQPASEVA